MKSAIKKPYFPRPCRGQSCPGFVKIDIRQATKYIREGNEFSGFIVGNKVHSFHFLKGWHLACPLDCDTVEAFESTINEFSFYMDPEIGNNVAIYLKIPRKSTIGDLHLTLST